MRKTGKTVAVTAAVQSLKSAEYEEKNDRIRKIIDDAAKLLADEGTKYFIGVLDRRPEEPGEGKAFCKSEVTGEDFIHILDMALPTRKDAVNLGIYVGQVIKSKQKNSK